MDGEWHNRCIDSLFILEYEYQALQRTLAGTHADKIGNPLTMNFFYFIHRQHTFGLGSTWMFGTIL